MIDRGVYMQLQMVDHTPPSLAGSSGVRQEWYKTLQGGGPAPGNVCCRSQLIQNFVACCDEPRSSSVSRQGAQLGRPYLPEASVVMVMTSL